ncbi:DMT family transporter [Moorena sp. SIO3I6]|uniref:DMT family transporter n=1 Tax=Moorena sp. SIO3I6 TaxID=2607831 RepID=UPI0025F9B4A0|nr:DMT family transporter [Moorena sp. SIO3I6]
MELLLKSDLSFGIYFNHGRHLFPLTQSAWFSVVALGIVVQVFGHGLLTYSFKHFSSSFVSVCLLLDPLITALFAWIIFAEKLTPLKMVSFLGVIAGIYLARLGKGSQKAG